MKNIIWFSITFCILLVLGILVSGNRTQSIYHVVLIPYNVTHKPILPSTRYNEYLIVINQSSFIYQLDASRKHYEFRVANQNLTQKELQDISKEMLPADADPKFYIF